MPNVLVSIGSNIDRIQHITAALDALSDAFGALRLSSVYESEAVGFDGDPFYNLVAAFETPWSVAALSVFLREIEYANGRCRDDARFSARTLDIDILTWGDAVGVVDGVLLPREEILKNAFVLQPLAELMPEALHPVTGKSYSMLWNAYDKKTQKLWKVDFCWNGQLIGTASGIKQHG